MSLIPKHSLFDFDQFFDHFFASGKVRQSEFFSPRIDVSETEDSFKISAELPGVKKEDIHVTFEQGMLSVEAEVKVFSNSLRQRKHQVHLKEGG
ncbi:Hsp20/alpha crystallin family protein [Algicola sagamiensis]|uniref:Hsp20/alpha crystallin family protein n=1 Tax=Algicola sagamiensis TaxID=163869 RepID=UPI0003A68EFE|nr:Hsp20/alpha crystallin family protein [Algicola sagamiensis]